MFEDSLTFFHSKVLFVKSSRFLHKIGNVIFRTFLEKTGLAMNKLHFEVKSIKHPFYRPDAWSNMPLNMYVEHVEWGSSFWVMIVKINSIT